MKDVTQYIPSGVLSDIKLQFCLFPDPSPVRGNPVRSVGAVPPPPAVQREDVLCRGAGQVSLWARLHDLWLPGLRLWGGRQMVPALEQDLLPAGLYLPGRHHSRQHEPGPLLLQAGRQCGVLLSAGLQAGGQASAHLWQERAVGRPDTEVRQH